jgi:Fe2+ transport system protein FeoA
MDLPLTCLKNGDSGVIVSINSTTGRKRQRRGWGFKRRLEEMGLTPGTEVTMVKSAPFHGPIEIYVRGSRLVIGRGMAERILVKVQK